MKIADIRKEYVLQSLEAGEVRESPFDQFHLWLKEAISSEVLEPSAMTLSTVNTANRPSSRVVLLKELDHGFVFFTNYESRKGKELDHNPYASIIFFWPELERQVRVEGFTEKIPEEQSDEYFKSRPIGSQIGAWASPQSKKIPNRAFLEERETLMKEKFNKEPLRRPKNWGGYRVIPHEIEFWQGRPNRLHDRILYELDETGNWIIHRLAP